MPAKKIGLYILAIFAPLMMAAARSGAVYWRTTNITGHLPDLQFSLVSDTGSNVTAKDYKGEVVLLYFGFTGCAAQCPVVMMRLERVLRRLGPEAEAVRILFASVDPAHDTPAILHRYVGLFDRRHAVGLIGSKEEIQELARRYRTVWQPNRHGATVYIFDDKGHARLLATPQDSDEDLLHDLKKLVP